MFSSSNNINPFPQIPSSSTFHVPFSDAEAAAASGFFPFHHHHQDPLLAGYYVPAGGNYNSAPQIFHNLGVLGGHDLGGGSVAYKNKDQENGDNNKKAAPRKDRHSKISTSQGLRDRRVRLSIGISREFFDLQDMLGFDTASKTLEWLLGKSKKDIQELEEKIKNKNMSSDNEQESNEEEEEEEGHVVPREKKKKVIKKSQKEAAARECRAKARERARERTREKLCISYSSTNTNSTCSTKACPHNHHQSNPSYHGLTQLGPHHQHHHNIASFLGVHEKPSSGNSQHQLIREENVRNKLMVNPGKGFVDWDITNAIRRSTICNATNLSTELQMYGKP